jgi:bifunctional ADP-heptose synthase (sugar kinase/adenylyltransferase)
VGDIITDEYITGVTSRISREAPVLILKCQSQEIVPGGAGNAVNNLAALGAKVSVIGVVGDDEMGKKITRYMKQRGVNTEGLIVEKGRTTITKTRILAGGHHTSRQQVIRLDREPAGPLKPSTIKSLQEVFNRELKKADAVIASDYEYGVLDASIIESINRAALKKLVTVDSRFQMLKFKGVAALTPNESEVVEALELLGNKGKKKTYLDGEGGYRKELFDDENNLSRWSRQILEQTQSRGVLITRGNKGMFLVEKSGRKTLIPIFGSEQAVDITGAGDTVISTFTLALAAGASMPEAARLSNYAGGLVVMKRGTATISLGELMEALEKDCNEPQIKNSYRT